MYTEKDVIDCLLQKIFYATSAPDVVSGIATPKRYLSVCMPGIPLPTAALDFGFATMTTDQVELAADFSTLTNLIPAWGATWTATGRTISGEYEKVLQHVQIPQPSFTQADLDRYRDAKKLLYVTQKVQDPLNGGFVEVEVESLIVQRYFEYKRKYDEAVAVYNAALISFLNKQNDPGMAAHWAQMKPILENDIRLAIKRWEGAGKMAVEQAWGAIGNFDSRGMDATWQDRRARLATYRKGSTIGDFYLTKYYPQKFWDGTAGWTSITLRHDEIHTVDQKETVNWGGGGGFNLGLWRAGGSASYESQKNSFSSDSENISISFQLATIPLLRGWLDMNLVESRNWRFDPGVVGSKYLLSDGAVPPTGSMPLLPTAMVLARDVVINFNKKSQRDSYAMTQVRGSASGGWGPFSVRANYFRRTEKTTHDFVEDDAGLKVPGMQLIAFVCRLLERTPNPDKSLNWGE